MALRYALLGLLADAPSSGYDLTKKFERTLGRFAWHARHSQIYPELNRLASDGLIELVTEGARGRKTYAITDSGHHALRTWLLTSTPEAGVRNEFVLRLFLVSTLDRDDARALLKRFVDEAERELAELRAILANAPPDWREAPLQFGHLAAEYGLRIPAVTRDLANWALERIDTDRQDTTDTAG